MSMGPDDRRPVNWLDQQAEPPTPPGTPPPGYAAYPPPQSYPAPQSYPPQSYPAPQSYPPPQGQPQGYAPPGQFGHPSPQQPYNAPPPPKEKGRAAWIVSGVVLVLLIAAGGGYFLLNSPSKSGVSAKGGGGNLPTATLAQRWTTSDTNDNLVGVWWTDHSVIRIGSDSANAYDLASGKKLFSIAPPKAGLKPCSASATLAPGGIGTIFYSKDGEFSCDTVIGVDVNTGKHLWTLHSSDSVVDNATGSTLIDGSVAVIASDSNAVAGVDAKTGDIVWKYTSTTKDCAPINTAGMGSVVIVQENCTAGGAVGKGNYVAVDAATGKHLWHTATAQDYGLRAVVSTDPVVLYVGSSKSTIDGLNVHDGKKFLAFDGSGRQTASIPADNVQAGSFLNTPFPHAMATKGTLYAETTDAKDGVAVTAYSLTTSAKLWAYQATFESDYAMDTLTIGLAPDSSPLVVVNLNMVGDASPVMKLDPATGRPSQVYAIPATANPDEALLDKTPDGDYVLAPLNPKNGPGLTVMAPK